MKRSRWCVGVVLVGMSMANCVPAQTVAQTGTSEQEVLVTDDRRTEALRRGNVAPLREIYLDDYTLVTPAGIIRSKADQINEIASEELRYGRIEVVERTVRVYVSVFRRKGP